MKKILILSSASVFLVLWVNLLGPSPIFAQKGQQGLHPTPTTVSTDNIFCADNKSVNTAIGCIPTDPQGFITKFLSLAVGLGGGIAFLLIIFGGFQIMTSTGNPEKLAAGKELISAAISGLLLIIFSLFLLRLIGYTIFRIPGFG